MDALDLYIPNLDKTRLEELEEPYLHKIRLEEIELPPLLRYQSPVLSRRYPYQETEISDERRKSLYFGTFFLDLIAFVILYAVLGLFFPLGDISWMLLIYLLILSRVADIVSTNIGLSMGGRESNPLSDPHDISKMMPIQVVQVGALIGFSFLLGMINPWLGNGLLLIFSLMGYSAAIANLGQAFLGPTILGPTAIFVATPREAESFTSTVLYTAHIVSDLVVGVITLIVLLYIFG